MRAAPAVTLGRRAARPLKRLTRARSFALFWRGPRDPVLQFDGDGVPCADIQIAAGDSANCPGGVTQEREPPMCAKVTKPTHPAVDAVRQLDAEIAAEQKRDAAIRGGQR